MTFPGFDHIYSLSDPLGSSVYRGEFSLNDDSFLLSRGECEPTAGVRVTWAMGAGVPSEVVWTTSAHPIILSGRIISILLAHEFTGWTTYPVRVFTRAGEELPDYHGLAVTGRSDRATPAQSSIVLRKYPGGWVPHFKGESFDPGSWDGSDFFMGRPDQNGQLSGALFVTEQVRDALLGSAVGNISFEKLSELEVNVGVYRDGLEHLLPPGLESEIDAAYREARVERPGWV